MPDTQQQIQVGGESFRLIAGTSSYYVSESGRIYYQAKSRFLTVYVQPIGYHMARFAKDGKSRQNHLVHRLVAQAYIPNPENKPTVNHKDGNKGNNHVSNLEWATMKEQINHADATGLMNRPAGENHHTRRIPASDETKAKQSEAKQGDKHPRFAGYYHTPFGVFGSAREAERAIGTMSHVTIGRKCKDGVEGWSFQEAA